MNDKISTKLAAVIEIEPTFARLKLSQLKKGKPDDLENLETPLHIGSELCSSGKIGAENLRELVKTLRGYGKIIRDYGIETCTVAAGHDFLSAENKAFVFERLKSRSGLSPKLYNFSMETALICEEAMRTAGLHSKEGRGSEIIAVFGSGTVGVTAFTNGNAVSIRAFPAGPLNLSRLFAGIQDMPDVAEAAEGYLDRLFSEEPFSKPENGARPLLILAGNSLEPVARLCGAEEEQTLEPKKMESLFEQICDLTPDRIGMKLGFEEEAAGELYFTLAAARSLVKTVSPSATLMLKANLADALTRQILLPKERSRFQSRARENAVSCARGLVRQTGRETVHAEFVRKLSCEIFERLKKDYGLDAKKKLALELAAILKQRGCLCGDEEIYGIEESTSKLISAALHGIQTFPGGKPADEKDLAAFRISAILSIAEALDFSYRQKLENIKIKVEKNKLKITAESREGTALEKWALGNRTSFFTEVFGLTPELTVKFAGTVR